MQNKTEEKIINVFTVSTKRNNNERLKPEEISGNDKSTAFTNQALQRNDKRKDFIKQSLIKFSSITSFHGVRYIAESDSHWRRLLWILTVLSCVFAAGYEIFDRVAYYRSWPVNVNVRINYNQSLRFPAVTVCNLNAFRATEATKYGHYELIEEIYTNWTSLSVETVQRHNANNITLEELLLKLGHTKQDLIVKCIWNNQECESDIVDTILTDHGLCYIFNGNKLGIIHAPECQAVWIQIMPIQPDLGPNCLQRLSADDTRIESGLRLTLNIEQYEYMPGPHDAAGVKILLHHPEEIPSVHGLGQAIAPGAHSFVGAKFLKINNLPHPYGNCKDKPLNFTTYYTTQECYLDCITKLAIEKCGCRNIYMPIVDGIPVCTLEKYAACLKYIEDGFYAKHTSSCDCPVPCQISSYGARYSYASISNHVVEKWLTSNESKFLKSKLLDAKEASSRMDKVKERHFKKLVTRVNETFIGISSVYEGISNRLISQASKQEQILNKLSDVYIVKERLYRYQEYAFTKNFLRGRDAMEERTLTNVALGFVEFAVLTVRRIRRLADIPKNDTICRRNLYQLIADTLKARQDIADMAKRNITILYKAFLRGKRIFNYKFEDIDRTHNDYIVPKPLLNFSMTHNWYIRKYAPKVSRDLRRIYNAIGLLTDGANVAYLSSAIDEEQLNYAFERFLFSCRTYLYSKSIFYHQGVDLPLTIMKDRFTSFLKVWDTINLLMIESKQNLNSLDEVLKEAILDSNLDFLNEKSLEYVDGKGNSLMRLANLYLSNATQAAISNTTELFQEVESRGQAIYDSWTMLLDPLRTFWAAVLDDEDMKEYYEFTNNSQFLQNMAEVYNMYVEWCIHARDQLDVRNAVQNEAVEFFSAFDELRKYLHDFKDAIRIDSQFLRENFLQLDVFFRELSYEHIQQQIAYSIFALLCDVGGSLGLFIGASLLTVIEIMELLAMQTPLLTYCLKSKLFRRNDKI